MSKNSSQKYTGKTFLLEIGMIIASFIILIPLLIMIFGSFKSPAEAAQLNISLPSQWVFDNYVQVFKEGNIGLAMKNSIIVVGFHTVLTIGISSICAFIIARVNSKFTNFLSNLFSLGLIVPLALVPTVVLMQKLHLMGTLPGLIIIESAIGIPWSLFVFTGFMKNIPRELDESAVIDGCNSIRMFYNIIFPLLKPVVATNVVILAMGSWNDFITPIYFLSSSKYTTMPLTVYNFFGQYQSYWNLVFADLVLTALPVTILYLFCQKYIVSGLTSGAVKG